MSPGRRPSHGSRPAKVSARPSSSSTPPAISRMRPKSEGLGTRLAAPGQLDAGEEVADLEASGVGRVRAVDAVGLDRACEVLADGPRIRLGRIRGTHDLAQAADGVLALEHQRHAGP